MSWKYYKRLGHIKCPRHLLESIRHLCSNKNIYLSESNTNNPKCYLLMQFAVNLAEKKLLN